METTRETTMKTMMLLALVLASTAPAQNEGKRKVEQPIKTGLGHVPEKFDLAGTGILWSKGLDAALGKGKPILLFQLLCNFDDVYC